LYHEASAVAKLNHPNILTVFDVAEGEQGPFIVMQLVDGQTLSERRMGEIEEIVFITIELCKALAHAHEKGIIHRDIKPSNVVITPTGIPKLMDFGIARSPKSNITQEGAFIGTVDYIAPEQARGMEIDHRADLYSLGVMVYQLTSGRLPFIGDTPIEVLTKHLTEPVESPRLYNPEIPSQLELLIKQLMSKNPDDRPESANSVKRVLEKMLEGDTGEKILSMPQLAASRAILENSPPVLTSFVGRADDLVEINKLIQNPGCQLVTMVGPGGIGKTRLAIEAANQNLTAFSDGGVFVSLAAISLPEKLVFTIAEALSITFDTQSGNVSPQNQLLDYLRTRKLLLVLDNFEHLMTGVGLVIDLLEKAPGVKILISSRERLNIQSEWIYQVNGLEYGTNQQNGNTPAFTLFVERAKQNNAQFQVTEDSQEHIHQICKLVEGYPLGIELAAAWISMLSCEEISDEIQNNMDILTSTRIDIPENHRSMRAAFEYSWNLLTEAQQEHLQKLSIFRGGFNHLAAKSITGGNLLLLSEFINKSLLRRNSQGLYEMPMLLRQYIEDRNQNAKDELDKIRERHAIYYIDFLAENIEKMYTGDFIRKRDKLRRELENVLIAVYWAGRYWATEKANSAIFNLSSFQSAQAWYDSMKTFQSLSVYIKEKRQIEDGNLVYAFACSCLAFYTSLIGLHEDSEKIAQAQLTILRKNEAQAMLGSCLFSLGINAIYQGGYEIAKTQLEEAHQLFVNTENMNLAASLELWLGWIYYLEGDTQTAQQLFEDSYQTFSEQNNQWGKPYALSKLGLAADAAQDFAQGRSFYNESMEISRQLEDPTGEGYAVSRMSLLEFRACNYLKAKEYGLLGYEIFSSIGHRRGIGTSLCRIGYGALGLGEVEEAEEVFFNAFERARTYQDIPLTLYALAGIAGVLGRQEETGYAVELLSLVIQHPVTPAVYREIAESEMERIKDTMELESFVTAKKKGQENDLELVSTLLLKRKKKYQG
jgi:serine/threonine protein kinase/tetratricopeptide (TPR) repeat protein